MQTNKHDKARLLHIRADPNLSSIWTKALREKNRVELDSSKSTDYMDPFQQLAEEFNDYERNIYYNCCLEYFMNPVTRTATEKKDSLGLPVYVPGLECIGKLCYDINPTSANRPMRDGGWIRSTYRSIRPNITKALENYNKSGNQEAENIFDEWVNFSSHFGDDVCVYARAVLNTELLDQLGKALPSNMKRDSGDGEEVVDGTIETSAQARARQRAAKRIKMREDESSSEFTCTQSDYSSSNKRALAIPGAFDEKMEQIERSVTSTLMTYKDNSNLELLLKYGNDEDKERALKIVRDSIEK
jgi:hypothetical protein